ncbi:hypothetical protein VB834_04785 [Limnoraphis robusta Tam1]|uniref:Sigma-70 family RNA polymerase sigma factor n=1 Tax=Limnoraphis robusta CCNP1315 TaxID=3110306 RepID=A0ABU5TYM2_9CYAN|nr:hypothetical protein [Limnoraphis robusta]MEA5499974.1 hypothetical protein [Limnoraphis robusta BA-68 BA1]MEA5520037.1 hypothetical protein [Limnoraphis robusta CCNP1315]MEA5538344.1 hypothetical protein [Limnoraphis robusta Tam1]MEA5548780.1 hypothetical protein [Limnoraphis robusta CCNP1324]
MHQGKSPIDSQFNQLAREAQQHPKGSYERRRGLNILMDKILKSDRLIRPKKGSFPFPVSIYEDLYNEAKSIMMMEICQNIDKYNPEQDVMAWCNFLLDKRFIDCFNQYTRRGLTYLPKGEKNEDVASLPNLEDLDSFRLPAEQISESQELQNLIEENPDNIFTKEYIKGQPKATFQFLAIAKIWQDRKWKDISAELNVPVSSLCEFYKKRLKEFTPYFREYLQN